MIRSAVVILCAIFCFECDAQIVTNSQNFSRELQQHALDSTVKITLSGPHKDADGRWTNNPRASSGVIVGRDDEYCYILTSSHGTDPFDADTICWVYFFGSPVKSPGYSEKKILARDRVNDIALLRVEGTSLIVGMLPICPKTKVLSKSKRWPVLTVGCSKGNAPSCETCWMTGKSFVASEYSESTFHMTNRSPTVGRSGGPQVMNPGYVIGTAVLGYEKFDVGGYSLTSSIYKLCDKADCSWLYSEEYTSSEVFWSWKDKGTSSFEVSPWSPSVTDCFGGT